MFKAEELQIIADMLTGLGSEAQRAFIFYLITKFSIELLTPLGFVSAVYIITKTIKGVVNYLSLTKTLQSILGFSGEVCEKERQEIIRILKVGLEYTDVIRE